MKSLKGHLLIAAPSLKDRNFHRTVILLFEHTSDGAGGVILNRPSNRTTDDVADKLFDFGADWKKTIYIGGPVQGPLNIIHQSAEFADMEIMPGLYGSVDADNLREIFLHKLDPALVVANYSGWGAGQLESEMEEDSWFTLPARIEHVFWSEEKDLWESVLAELNYKTIGSTLGVKAAPKNPDLN